MRVCRCNARMMQVEGSVLDGYKDKGEDDRPARDDE